jgi:Leucine-rich repeat (LRR) protein
MGMIPDFRESIVDLDLSYNFLSGLIPSSLGKLCKLSKLLLNFNHLEKRIPSVIVPFA